MKVAAIQMVSGTQVNGNLVRAQALLERAATQGAELAVLPEYFCLMGRRDADKLVCQEMFGDGPIQLFLSGMARALDLWIVGGTLPLTPADSASHSSRVFNSSLVFAPDGRCVGRYDKIHLFRFDDGIQRFDEAAVQQAGRVPATFDLPSRDGHRWRVGLSVCYDLRFPELYRHYAAQGVDLFTAPSAFTYPTGEAHWSLLTRARAVENLAGMVAAAQGGYHENGRRTWGHTMVIDAWGQVLGQYPEGEAVVVAELDAAHLAQCRARLPALSHRML